METPLTDSITLEAYEKIEPVCTLTIDDKQIHYAIPSTTTKWRVDTLFTKEPDTIEWIESFNSKDVFLDIGANVGMYTIFASAYRGVTTYAFEPESLNFSLLNRNLYLNHLHNKVTAYCIAISDVTKFDKLYLSSFTLGGSCHSFSEEVDFHLNKMDSPFEQGSFSTTIDEMVNSGVIEQPNHIKVDVDGFEHKVFDGAIETLTNPICQSILLELNTNLELHRTLIGSVEKLGYKLDREGLKQSIRADGAFKGVGNHVFRR